MSNPHRCRISLALISLLLVVLPQPWQQARSARLDPRADSPQQPSLTQFEMAVQRTQQLPESVRNNLHMSRLLKGVDIDENDEEEVAARRRLSAADGNWFGLRAPRLRSGPSMAAVNMSFFRWESVHALSYVDWRTTMMITPIQRQFQCASCWAITAVDSIAMMWAIATGTPATPLSPQQVCDCATKQCCQGGWPDWAFSYVLSNNGVTQLGNYPYVAADSTTCYFNATEVAPLAKISGWELVPAFNPLALMKAVTTQPVIAFVSAASNDFRTYNSRDQMKIYDGMCTTEINHAVLVVGYNYTGPSLVGSYWIIKNSFYNTWGDKGYMYLAMTPDVRGKCGMLTVPPMYPVYYPVGPQPARFASNMRGRWKVRRVDDLSSELFNSALTPSGTNSSATSSDLSRLGFGAMDPCADVINPCGAGVCYSSFGMARCDCSAVPGMVEVIASPTSKCVPRYPCSSRTSGTVPINPCGGGTCSDLGDGSYTCNCSPGFAIGAAVDGSPTCMPSSGVAQVYTTVPGDTCSTVGASYNLTSDSLMSLNTWLNCTATDYLPPGIAITIASSPNITTTTVTTSASTTTSTSTSSSTSSSSSSSVPATVTTTGAASTSVCTSTHNVRNKDTCWSLATTYFGGSINNLLAINPRLSCIRLFKGQQVCLVMNTTTITPMVNTTASLVPPAPIVNTGTTTTTNTAGMVSDADMENKGRSAPECGQTYIAAVGESCETVASRYMMSSRSFSTLNPVLDCSLPLPVGASVCVAAKSAQTTVNCTSWYRVAQGDTCPIIWNAANLTLSMFTSINPGIRCEAPYLSVGQMVCIDSPVLVTMRANPNVSYSLHTVRNGENLAIISSIYISRCTPASVSPEAIAAANNLPNNASAELETNSTIIIPCVGRAGVLDCGCATSVPVCGADYLTYPSYCDAVCNYAVPIRDSAPCNRVLEFVRQQNRPVNVQNVADALQKYSIKKTAVQKALDAAGARGDVAFKDYGKQRIFMARQDVLDVPDTAGLDALKAGNEQLREQTMRLREDCSAREKEVQALEQSLTAEEIEQQRQRMEEENAAMETKLEALRNGGNNISSSQRQQAEEQYQRFMGLWRKRKRLFNTFFSTVTDGMSRSVKEFQEELGVETDEDIGVSIQECSDLQASMAGGPPSTTQKPPVKGRAAVSTGSANTTGTKKANGANGLGGMDGALKKGSVTVQKGTTKLPGAASSGAGAGGGGGAAATAVGAGGGAGGAVAGGSTGKKGATGSGKRGAAAAAAGGDGGDTDGVAVAGGEGDMAGESLHGAEEVEALTAAHPTARLAFASAFATGYVHEKLPLFTTEGRQQGFLEVIMKLPAVIERIKAQLAAAEAARRIEEMRIVEARAVYAAKLKDALKYRKQQAAAKADAQQEVMDGSLISLNNAFSYAMADHSSRTNTAKAAFLGADAASAEQLKAALVVDEPGFYAKLCKETEGEEEFRPEIDAYTGAVFGAARKRYGAVDKAKTDFETAVEEAVTNYLIKLQNIQTGFEKEAGEASKEYMKEARTKIFWKEEAQAESDVAAYKPPL
ncbi:unnamed protein product [Closterium sp. Naga37s-1]|nr:unnamed protein product [Closterium sp. Naga37s-1]